MSGNSIGGKKAALVMKQRYGDDFHKKIGRAGGIANGGKGGFGSSTIGRDGLTGQERAKLAGQKGGKATRKPKTVPTLTEPPKKHFRLWPRKDA